MSDPTLLLTRPRAASERFAAACRSEIGRDIPVLISPVLEIRPRPVGRDLSEIGTFLFTSENGVACLAAQTDLSGRKALCVGDHTAREAEAAGMVARSAGGDAEALLAMIVQTHPAEPLLHVRGVHAAVDLAGRLAALGIAAQEVIVYDQHACPLSTEALRLLTGGDPVILPLFSPRSAALVVDQLGRDAGRDKENVTIVAISPAVASAWGRDKALVAKAPDGSAMLAEVARLFATTRLVAPRSGG